MAHNDHPDKQSKRKEIPSSLWVFALATFVLALPRIGGSHDFFCSRRGSYRLRVLDNVPRTQKIFRAEK